MGSMDIRSRRSLNGMYGKKNRAHSAQNGRFQHRSKFLKDFQIYNEDTVATKSTVHAKNTNEQREIGTIGRKGSRSSVICRCLISLVSHSINFP